VLNAEIVRIYLLFPSGALLLRPKLPGRIQANHKHGGLVEPVYKTKATPTIKVASKLEKIYRGRH